MPLHRLPPQFGATGGDGGNIVAAGTQTADSTGTVMFSNSNGITFGMSNSSIITASHNGITSQTNQTLGMYGTSNTTQGTSGTVDARSLTFKGDGIVSVGISNGSVVISATGAGGGNINVSAGTTSNDLTNFVLADGNGVSFGLDGSTVTASHNGLTSQSNQALSAGNGSFTFQTASFADSNGVSFSTGTQGIYASHNALTSQSNQALSAANGSFTFQTATFANSNGVSFSTGTQGIYATVKTDYLTTMLTHNSVHHSGTIFPGTDQYVGSAFLEYGTTSAPSTPGAGKIRHVAIAENGKVRDAVVTPDGTTFVREQDQYITVVNDSGSTITKGKWVYFVGQSSGVPTIGLADKDSNVGEAAIGIVLEDIANGANGRVQISGIATGLDTSSFTVGDFLILDATGDATTSAPSQSFLFQYTAIVLVDHATTGKLLLFPLQRPAYGQEYYFTNDDIYFGNTAATRARLAFTATNKVGVVQWTGTNNRTFHLPGETAANATLMTNFNVSAGAASNNLTALTFANSNGITFGLNASTITASHNGITSQTNQTLGLYASSNTTAQSSSSTADARSLTFRGMGVASVGMSAGEVVISVPSGGGAGDGVNILAAGTQTANTTGTVLFNDSNGITFGMSNSSVITASHNGLTSQSNQALSGSNGSFTFQTATLGNLNGLSFYTSNGSMVGSYTVPSTAGLISNINVSAGSTSNNLSALTFSDSNGVSFGLNGSVVTATVKTDYLTSQSNQAVSAANGSYAFQTLSFSNANGVSFGTSAGSAVTASHNGLTSQSNQALSAANGSFTFQTATFANSNGVSFSTGTQGLYATVATNYAASDHSHGNPTLALTNLSGTTASASNGFTLSLSAAAPGGGAVVSNAIQSVGSATGSGTNTSRFAADDHVHAGVFSVGVSNVGNTAGDTRVDVGRFVFAGGNNITLSQGTAANALNTITISAAAQTNQTLGLYATSNTTQNSSSTLDARSLTFQGAGAASVGFSNGSIIISAPSAAAGNVTFSGGTSSAGLASIVFSNSNGVSFGLNGSTMTGSVSQTNQTVGVYATSNTTGQSSSSTIDARSVSFVGAGNVYVGMSAGQVLIRTPATYTRNIWVPAAAMRPSATGGCAALTAVATSANHPDVLSLDFDSTTAEYAQFSIRLPKSWDEGTITAAFHWSHASTTTNFGVRWGLQAVACSDDDTIDVAYGTAQEVTDTGGTTSDLYISSATAAITIAGTPAVGDQVFFRVYRDPANAGDTMAIDARLMGITIFYTVDTLDDA